MSGQRSAIVVSLPIPEPLEAIRLRHVPVARLGVPAHVTIVAPFKPIGAVDAGVVDALAAIAAAERPIDVRFEGVGRFPGFLWAAPHPSRPFERLTRRVVDRYPEDHPFDDAFPIDRWIPHLTLAEGGDEELDALERAAMATGALPFEVVGAGLDVMVEEPGHRWQTVWRLPFRP
jgi:2'-5' RNA ligase